MEKIINKLLKKAVEVESIEIKNQHLTIVKLEDFAKIKGEKIELTDDKGKKRKSEVIFCDNEFYKKTKDGYIKTSAVVSKDIKKLDELEQRIKNIEEWCRSFKEYVDKRTQGG